MIFDESDPNCYNLSTGRQISANNRILGINPDGELHEGYDGIIHEDKLSSEEIAEICSYAISLWINKLAIAMSGLTKEGIK